MTRIGRELEVYEVDPMPAPIPLKELEEDGETYIRPERRTGVEEVETEKVGAPHQSL